MSFPSQKETYDSYPPSSSSGRTSMNGVLHHRSSKATIQSHQESISNFSVHTATAAIDKDTVGPSIHGPLPSVSHNSSNSSNGRVSDHKSFHSLEKPTFDFQNQSLSTVHIIREPESNNSFTPISTLRQTFRSLSRSAPEDEAKPYLRSIARRAIPPTHNTDPSPSLNPVYAVTPSPPINHGDFEPLATTETSTAETPSIGPAPFLLRPTDPMGTTRRSHGGTGTAKGKKRMPGFMTHFFKSNKRPEISTPHDPLHLTHVGFDSSTSKSTGLPKGWKRVLQNSGVSKSAQEKDLLAVMEVVQFQEGGDVPDRMGHAPVPGSSQSPRAADAAHPGISKTVDDSFSPTLVLSPSNLSHSLDDPQSASPSQVSYRPAPSPPGPAQPNLEQRSGPKSLVRAKDRDLLAPPASFLIFFATNTHKWSNRHYCSNWPNSVIW